MSNVIESKGREILFSWLKSQGRKFSQSDDRTFDLVVDGVYAELKAKSRGWKEFDFIALSKNQQMALGRKLKKVFLVLNVADRANAEVVEIDAEDLAQCLPKEIVHFEWNKGTIAHLRKKPCKGP